MTSTYQFVGAPCELEILESEIDPRERRAEPRYESQEPAVVSVLDEPRIRLLAGVTVNVSKSGLRVRIGEEVGVGARVRVRMKQTVAFGEVRWGRRMPDGRFDVGLRIQSAVELRLIESLRRAADGPASGRTPDGEAPPPAVRKGVA